MNMIKIAIVEDLEEVTEGLVAFIQQDNMLQHIASYRTAEAATIAIFILFIHTKVIDCYKLSIGN